MALRIRKTFIIISIALVGLIYFFIIAPQYPSSPDFRKTTEAGIARKHSVLLPEGSDTKIQEQAVQDLQAILAKQQSGDRSDVITEVNDKAESQPSRTDEEKERTSESEVGVAGRVTMTKSPKEQPKYPKPADDSDEDAVKEDKKEKPVDKGKELAREELQKILKRSPMIIFSKTYCQFSKRAKSLLLDHYVISPAPFVVELDTLTDMVPPPSSDDSGSAPTMGKKIQELLAELTGRRTVPNIMVNAKSLGGSDDVVKMDHEGTLVDEIKRMGGKRFVTVEKKKE